MLAGGLAKGSLLVPAEAECGTGRGNFRAGREVKGGPQQCVLNSSHIILWPPCLKVLELQGATYSSLPC